MCIDVYGLKSQYLLPLKDILLRKSKLMFVEISNPTKDWLGGLPIAFFLWSVMTGFRCVFHWALSEGAQQSQNNDVRKQFVFPLD